jgi:hypothetical protein
LDTDRHQVDHTLLAKPCECARVRPDRFADRAVNNLPTLFVALREHLGLALEPDRGPVRSIVIEHAERPIAELNLLPVPRSESRARGHDA